MAYSGHQFGSFSPQLGDGRAILLGDPDALYLPNDNHWSALGNQLAAQALTEWLAKVLGHDAGIASRLDAAG